MEKSVSSKNPPRVLSLPPADAADTLFLEPELVPEADAVLSPEDLRLMPRYSVMAAAV